MAENILIKDDEVEFVPKIIRRMSAIERAREFAEINNVISGKNVLVTGGVSGLGAAYVKVFLQHNANKVAIIDIDAVNGQRSVNVINKTAENEKVIFICADVAKHEEMIDAFKEASEAMGGIDIVINNAGILDERRWEREIAVNVNGNVSCALLAFDHMSKDNGGRGGTLVNVSQHTNLETSAQLPIYTATKWATIGLSKSLGATCYLEKKGIRVMTLCPGFTETALLVDSPNKLLSRVMKADFVRNLEQLSIQMPYVVAKGLMSVLSTGEHGSIWVVENGGPPYEVCIPDRRTLRRSFRDDFECEERRGSVETPSLLKSNTTDLQPVLA